MRSVNSTHTYWPAGAVDWALLANDLLANKAPEWPNTAQPPSAAFLIQFVEDGESLERFATDSFDLAVIQAPSAEDAPEVIRQLTRVARQGLIARC